MCLGQAGVPGPGPRRLVTVSVCGRWHAEHAEEGELGVCPLVCQRDKLKCDRAAGTPGQWVPTLGRQTPGGETAVAPRKTVGEKAKRLLKPSRRTQIVISFRQENKRILAAETCFLRMATGVREETPASPWDPKGATSCVNSGDVAGGGQPPEPALLRLRSRASCSA